MSVFYVTVPMLPPSGNSNAVRSNWRGFHTHKKRWQLALVQGILEAGVPRHTGAFVRATAELTVPDRRRRDSDNHEGVLRKALGDALQEAHVIPDDTPREWSWTSVDFTYRKGERATTVILELVEPLAVAA